MFMKKLWKSHQSPSTLLVTQIFTTFPFYTSCFMDTDLTLCD
jgi:hypothetical protein